MPGDQSNSEQQGNGQSGQSEQHHPQKPLDRFKSMLGGVFGGRKKAEAAAIVDAVSVAQRLGESGLTTLAQEKTRPIRLTAVEEHQAFKPERSPKDPTMELATKIHERISADHRLAVQLLTNPFAPRTREIFETEFGQPLTPDAIRALVLAEPRELYDQAFSRLSSRDREAALYAQLDASADTTIRMGRFVEKAGADLFAMSDEQLFQELSREAFGGRNKEKIGREFSQSQRRGFRLSIVNFIQDMRRLQPHGQEFIANLPQVLERYGVTRAPIANNSAAKVEVTPLGIVVILPTEDYALVLGEQEENIGSKGKTFFSLSLPPELRGRVILIDGGPMARPMNTSEIAGTRQHELQHIAFASFFERDERHDGGGSITDQETYADHITFARTLKTRALEMTANEVISYTLSGGRNGRDYESLSALGGDAYEIRMGEVRRHLMNGADSLTGEQKQAIYARFEEQRIRYMEQTAEYQWIVHKFFDVARKGQNGLYMEKAIALLQNMRPDRVDRLAIYLKTTPLQLHNEYVRDRDKTLQDLVRKVDKAAASSGGKTGIMAEQAWVDAYSLVNKATNLYPVEIVPTLLKIITEAPSPYFVRTAMESLAGIVATQASSLPESTIQQAKDAIALMRQRRVSYDFRGVVADSYEVNRLLAWTEPKSTLDRGGSKDSLRPDFVKGAALRSKIVALVGDKPIHVRYTPQQERALVEGLTGEELLAAGINRLADTPESLTTMMTLFDKVVPVDRDDAYSFIANGVGLAQRLIPYFKNLTVEQRQALDRILDVADDPQYLPSYWPARTREDMFRLRKRDVEEIRKRLPPIPTS